MSELMQIFTGNPMTTVVGRKIEQATDENLPSDDWSLNLEICDLINETDEGARDAVRAIRKRLQTEAGRNFTVTHRTLTVLETCVNNCGRKFHTLVMTKDFIGELVKVIGPKNNPPTDLQDRVLSLIERWAVAFDNQPDLNGVFHVYHELKSKGITFPPQNLDTLAPIETPRRSVPPTVSPPRDSDLVLSSSSSSISPSTNIRNPRIVPVPLLMPQQQNLPTMAQNYDKIMSDLTIVQSSVNVFNAILSSIDSSAGQQGFSNDDGNWILMKDLECHCKQMKLKIVDLIENVTNEDVTSELLRLNDELNNVFIKYERALKKRAASNSSITGSATATEPGSSTSAKSEAVTKELIDLNDSGEQNLNGPQNLEGKNLFVDTTKPKNSDTNMAQTASDPDFDIFAQSRSSVYSDRSRPTNYDPIDETSTSLSKLALNKNRTSTTNESTGNRPATSVPDEISSVRESDFEEVEKWLASDGDTLNSLPPGSSGPVSIPNSDFENFLATRALAGSSQTSAGTNDANKPKPQADL